jgi:threonine dehydrogenase-like Zn-dependent dehydrogenase
MRALYYAAWQNVEVREVPSPHLQEGEVLVRVSHCGICGSELETFRNQSPRRTPPLVMGHEFCGFVEKTCDTTANWRTGSPVIVHALIHCGSCAACRRDDTNLCVRRQLFGMHRPGGYAEYVAVPEKVLVPWPEDMPGTTAIFAEPLANAINAMRQGSQARRRRVVIIGAGPIGLMCVLAAKQVYRSDVVVSDLISERLEAARAVGADVTVQAKLDLPSKVRDCWPDGSAEFVIDAVGSSATKRLSLELVEPGGMVVWLGLHQDEISLSSYALTLEQKSVSGSYSGSMKDLQRAVKLLSSGILDTSWATQYPLEQGPVGFRNMLDGKGRNIKGILNLS